MITGTLKCGFEFSIPKAKINNMELIDVIAELDTNPLAMSKALNLVLEPAQKAELYNCLRLEDGTVPVQAVSDALIEIFHANQQTKNS